MKQCLERTLLGVLPQDPRLTHRLHKGEWCLVFLLLLLSLSEN